MNTHTPIPPEPSLLETAQTILRDGASVTLGIPLDSVEEREMLMLAQGYIDCECDDGGDFASYILKMEQQFADREEYLDSGSKLDFEDWLDGIEEDSVNFGRHHPDSPSFGSSRGW